MNITTLIPAYKKNYLFELLSSIRNQTVKPSRVIISDDNPEQFFLKALNSGPIKSAIADLKIEVVPGPRTGALDNFRNLLQLWGGSSELFHFLLDDDVIYPTFYEQHLRAHATGLTKCSVSRRWNANHEGLPTSEHPLPAQISSHPQKVLAIEAPFLFATTVAASSNWLGEFSNAVFSGELADVIDTGHMASISYLGLDDLGAFLHASLRAPIGFINDHLGYFRNSPEQHSADPMGLPMKLAHLAYLSLAISGQRIGTLGETQKADCFARLCPLIASRYARENDMAAFCALMPQLSTASKEAEDDFLRQWEEFTNSLTAQWPQEPKTNQG